MDHFRYHQVKEQEAKIKQPLSPGNKLRAHTTKPVRSQTYHHSSHQSQLPSHARSPCLPPPKPVVSSQALIKTGNEPRCAKSSKLH